MVFHTAPPQPASKARITCSPVLVGGADASQKGFGDAIPAKFTARLGTLVDMRTLQQPSDRHARALALGHRIDHLAAAVHAVAAREVARIRGLSGLPIRDDAAVLQ